MDSMQLGRLEKVDLRHVWENEAQNFTPWLAREENLALLGQEIGIELQLEAQEREVGRFQADLLCKDTLNDSWVLIENQLEQTDHRHLGQLITYAAGLSAVAIVWVARHLTEEHRAALDWLNDVTDERANFFGIEVELFRIGDSEPAPRFNVVCKPNEWVKSVSGAARRGGDEELTPAKKLQRDFWITFREHLLQADTPLKPTKPLPQHWMNLAIGRSGFGLAAIASTYNQETSTYDGGELRAEIEIHGPEASDYFGLLEGERQDIESEIPGELTWYNPDDANMCRIHYRQPVDLEDRDQWRDYCEWLRTHLEYLYHAFSKRVKRLDLQDVAGAAGVPERTEAL